MDIGTLGEFGLIERLRQLFEECGVAQRPGLVVGIGDDAAVWRASGALQVITTDAMVEDVHFRLGQVSWQELGWKALAINLSDLAAMGAKPDLAVVSMALPRSTQVESLEAFCRGMAELARQHRVTIAGGNLARSTQVQIHITVIGHMPRGNTPLTRGSARPGDVIAVTGSFGGAAGWLRCGDRASAEVAATLRQAHYRPQPRLTEGRLLCRARVRAAIDISDGLAADLAKLCQASGVAARLDLARVPVHPALAEVGTALARELALYGGEDYELLFAAPAEVVGLVARQSAVPIATVGVIVAGPPGQVELVAEDGPVARAAPQGWDHFAQR